MLLTNEISNFQAVFKSSLQKEAVKALEHGNIIFFPNLNFNLLDSETCLLTPSSLDKRSKNISYYCKTDQLKSSAFASSSYEHQLLKNLMQRYSKQTTSFIQQLFPEYQLHVILGRTSYRPAEIKGRIRSIRQDDTRLHVDAFPTTPTQGNRILRMFTNINPHNQGRLWHIGEPFEIVATHFKNNLFKPFFGIRHLLSLVRLTKSFRTLYDHYMLQLHNAMKESDQYQNTVHKISQSFPAASSWIVMTDQVSHAALSGQYVLEQTFYLPIAAMQYPSQSPLKVLERILTTKLL